MSDFGGAAKPLSENPDYKIAILGVPFDEKSSYLRGAAQGPEAVRAGSVHRAAEAAPHACRHPPVRG